MSMSETGSAASSIQATTENARQLLTSLRTGSSYDFAGHQSASKRSIVRIRLTGASLGFTGTIVGPMCEARFLNAVAPRSPPRIDRDVVPRSEDVVLRAESSQEFDFTTYQLSLLTVDGAVIMFFFEPMIIRPEKFYVSRNLTLIFPTLGRASVDVSPSRPGGEV